MDRIHSYNQIQDAIATVKEHKEGFITNFFLSEVKVNLFARFELMCIVNYGKCIFILRKDHDFYHVYFFVSNCEELKKALSGLIDQYPHYNFVTDILSAKSAVGQLLELYEQVGFRKYTTLCRMSRIKNLDQPQIIDLRVKCATIDQSEQICTLFEEYFDKYCEQIPLIEEINQWIESKQIFVVVEQNEVIGFVVFEINGLTSYLRYWFTHPNFRNKKIGSALLRRFFYECRYSKRQLFWVLQQNENAIVRYKNYGFEFEQMFDYVMIKYKNNEATDY